MIVALIPSVILSCKLCSMGDRNSYGISGENTFYCFLGKMTSLEQWLCFSLLVSSLEKVSVIIKEASFTLSKMKREVFLFAWDLAKPDPDVLNTEYI